MDEFSTTSDNLDQTDEDILTYTVRWKLQGALRGGWPTTPL
jgi:hypothetical protein